MVNKLGYLLHKFHHLSRVYPRSSILVIASAAASNGQTKSDRIYHPVYLPMPHIKRKQYTTQDEILQEHGRTPQLREYHGPHQPVEDSIFHYLVLSTNYDCYFMVQNMFDRKLGGGADDFRQYIPQSSFVYSTCLYCFEPEQHQ